MDRGQHTASYLAVIALILSTGMASSARANERRFTYTYESATLPAGAAEFEPWTTVRAGRDDYYLRMDHRLEFELGLLDQLMTAFYINFSAIGADVAGVDASGMPTTVRTNEFAYGGIATEWKWKLMDPVADAAGLALYLEAGLEPSATAIEAKLIVDKRIGDLILAGNLVGEVAMEEGVDEVETEIELESDWGIAYLFTERFSAGIEARTHTEILDGELEHTAIFAGPTVGYGTEAYWIALTTLFQAAALGHGGDGVLDLEDHEVVNARLLIGMSL